jgi:hypothetical protein
MPVANSVTVTNGSAIVAGYLTSFVAADGDLFVLGDSAIPVASADSTIQITLKWAWPGTTATDRTDFYILKTGAFWHDNVNTLVKVNELLQKIDLGLPFTIDDAGTLAQRSRDDDQPAGFKFLAVDFPAKMYVKIGPNPTDWSLGIAVQNQATEAALVASAEAQAARDIAVEKADDVVGYAASASTDAATATTQAGIATTQAGIATTQASGATSANTAAQSAKTAAQTSQTNAANSATAAAGSASTASTQATNASNSATAAQTARTAAETAATNAGNSATSAATSATNAAASAAAAQQAFVVIASGTVPSAVANLTLTLPSGYKSFQLLLRRLLPVTDNVFQRMLVSLDGTTFASAASSYFWNITYSGHLTAPAKFAYNNDVSTAIDLSAWQSASDATFPSFTVAEIDPGGSGRRGSILFRGGKEAAGAVGEIVAENGFGYRDANGRWQAVRLFFSAGNIAAGGEYELYGKV